jgi:hypothetical protein
MTRQKGDSMSKIKSVKVCESVLVMYEVLSGLKLRYNTGIPKHIQEKLNSFIRDLECELEKDFEPEPNMDIVDGNMVRGSDGTLTETLVYDFDFK